MSYRPLQIYEDNKTYPILVKYPGAGYHHIVEMLGSEVNRWNRMVELQNPTKRPIGTI